MQPTNQLRMMVSRGRTFSGHERNCAFLNMGKATGAPPQFANISVGSGLDFADDGRAVALADWDHDGDLDVWFTNRNAPRLRLMINDSPSKHDSLGLRLRGNGTTTNRDAIGARVEVIAGGKQSNASLRAGEGFIAQSSKWLHFGLGNAKIIESIRVRWPDHDGTTEEFTEIEASGRYILVQGQGKALPESPRAAVKLESSNQTLPPMTRIARIPLVTLLDAPALTIADGSGRIIRIGGGKPVLINLWASWCAPCVAELADIRDRESEIRAAGIEVIALSVDALESDAPDIAAVAAGAAIEKLGFPFVSAIASEQIVGLLQWNHDNAVGRKRRLPLPSSFLIDAEGRVAVIYKGRISVDALLADVDHSKGTRSERWQRAAMLPGRSIEHESITRSVAKIDAKLFFDHAQQQEGLGATNLAIKYYNEALRNWPEFDPALRSLGNIYANRQRWSDALNQFNKLSTHQPTDAAARFALALCNQHLGQTRAARTNLEETIRLKTDHVPALNALGMMNLSEGDTAGAIENFRTVLQFAPIDPSARNRLAWILATNRDESLRDGAQAIKLASALVRDDTTNNPMFLDTLAAAQAEVAEYKKAIATARRGIELATETKNDAVATTIEGHLKFYERGEAYRE
jgi:tetratricopeptide (TPR) repeat protein